MKFKPYPKYKPSGVEWLGDIPQDWILKRLKNLGQAITGLTYDPSQVVDATDGILVLRSSNVQGGSLAFEDNVYVKTTIPPELITRLGDILICSRNGSRALIGKNAVIDHSAAGTTFGAFMTVFRSMHNRYLSWVFNSELFKFQAGAYLTSTINQLTVGNLRSFEVPFPPQLVQKSIANFLDRETAKIDTLIAKQEKLIELLKEKRQAVISHAVTKGLDPNVPMKPSGVEWLGDVPEHWQVKRLKYLCDVQTGDKDTVNAVEDGDFPFFVRSQTIERINSWVFDCEAVLTAGDGAGVGKVFHYFNGRFDFHQRVYMLNNFREVTGKYLFYFLKENFHRVALEGGAKSTVDSLRMPLFLNFNLTVPPLETQARIVAQLDKITAHINALISKAERAIALQKEHRTALISAAVTGKIDVREAASSALSQAA